MLYVTTIGLAVRCPSQTRNEQSNPNMQAKASTKLLTNMDSRVKDRREKIAFYKYIVVCCDLPSIEGIGAVTWPCHVIVLFNGMNDDVQILEIRDTWRYSTVNLRLVIIIRVSNSHHHHWAKHYKNLYCYYF